MKPRLLDLFCGAGGAGMGYARAGFEVVGVDINPQPRYPFEFIHADALDFLSLLVVASSQTGTGHGFAAIHASPPCQSFTKYRNTGAVGVYPDLIDPTREVLDAADVPWVMENVEGSPLLDPVLICGSMFDPPMDVRRHRLFETNWNLEPPAWPCRHKLMGPDRFPGGRSKARTGSNRGLVRATVEVGTWDIPKARQEEAMGIDWMSLEELSESIPPAYTEHIGGYLMAEVKARLVSASPVRDGESE